MLAELNLHIASIQACRQCPDMQPSPVTGQAVASQVMLVEFFKGTVVEKEAEAILSTP